MHRGARVVMSSSFDKTACDHRQFANRALDFVHGDRRIAFGHIDWSSCDFVGKYGAGKRRFGVVVSRDSRATLGSCLFVIIPAANNAQSRMRGVGTSRAPSMQVTSIHARSVS